MLRTVLCVMSLACLTFVAALTISCGSSNNNNQACTGGPYNVVGDWTLTESSTSGPGVINTAGLAVFFQSTTNAPAPGVTVVMPTITGACSFSGNATAYPTPALIQQGVTGGSSPIQGNVNSSTSISGTIDPGTSNATSLSIQPNSTLSGSVTIPSTSMQAQVEGTTSPDILTVTFSGTTSSMSFSGNDGFNCSISGTFTQEGTNNVFDTQIIYTGSGCPATGTVGGLGFESNTDYFGMNGNGSGLYLYAASSSSSSVLEIYP